MSCVLTASNALASTAATTKVVTVPCHAMRQRTVSFLVHLSCYPPTFRGKCIRESHSLLGRKSWSRYADVRSSLSIYRMPSASSNGVPAEGSDENDRHSKANTPAEGGIRQWVENFSRGRRAQNKELVNNLKRYGAAGMLSYGLLNTFYYLVTFLFVWFYVAPAEGGLGFVPAAQRFVKVFAMVWAGSQVTKLIRAAGALTLAPFVDRGLDWYTDRFNFKSRGKAFSFVVVACILLAISVFLIVTTLWA